jgi:hypothetical protein
MFPTDHLKTWQPEYSRAPLCTLSSFYDPSIFLQFCTDAIATKKRFINYSFNSTRVARCEGCHVSTRDFIHKLKRKK